MAEAFNPATVSNLTNQTSITAAIDSNFAVLASLLNDVLSRSGTNPNTMSSVLDMNSNSIINLPAPTTSASPARLQDISNIAIGNSNVPANTLISANNTWTGTNTFSGTLTAGNGATLGSGSLTTTGTGKATLAFPGTARTFTFPNSSGTLLSTSGATTVNTAVTDPAVTSSQSGVMMGIAGSFTPLYSTRALFCIIGSLFTSGGGSNAISRLRYGTGAAPVNGAAIAGTALTNSVGQYASTESMATATTYLGIATGLTPGVAYWFDIGLAGSSGGQAGIKSVTTWAIEI